MADMDLKLDHAGFAEVLKSPEMAAAVHDVAEQVAGNVDGDDLEVVVDDYTTDRAATSVTIRDARAQFLQARDGILTRAAAAAGLEVKAKAR